MYVRFTPDKAAYTDHVNIKTLTMLEKDELPEDDQLKEFFVNKINKILTHVGAIFKTAGAFSIHLAFTASRNPLYLAEHLEEEPLFTFEIEKSGHSFNNQDSFNNLVDELTDSLLQKFSQEFVKEIKGFTGFDEPPSLSFYMSKKFMQTGLVMDVYDMDRYPAILESDKENTLGRSKTAWHAHELDLTFLSISKEKCLGLFIQFWL